MLLFPIYFSYALRHSSLSFFFFFNDTATTEIYTLSLHDALPIFSARRMRRCPRQTAGWTYSFRRVSLFTRGKDTEGEDRKSTRLNSSHQIISYAVFCLKKKKFQDIKTRPYQPTAQHAPMPVSHDH